jgi:PAS domain S-box-containing protein
MQPQFDQPAEEIKHLQRCMNDLVSLLALPAIWSGGGPSQVARTLLDVLLGMLRLDLLYVRLSDEDGGEAPVEMARLAQSIHQATHPQAIGAAVERALGDAPLKWEASARMRIGDAELAVLPMRLGLNGEIGVVVAGSQRSDFPRQTERLLLNVAANQAAIALHEGRLLVEQKRVATDLDRRVAQRTRELAEANDALQREIAERRRAEEALRESERSLRSVVDGVPGLVAILAPDGDVQVVNRRIVEYCGRPLEELKNWGTNGTVHDQDIPHVAVIFTKSIASGVSYEIEQRLRRFDGVYRWFQNRGVPVRDASGRIVCWYVLLTDIDERKRAEEKLRRSEAFLAEGQRLSLTGSCSWRVDTDEIAFSEELYRIFEFEEDSPVTLQRMEARVHPEDLPLMSEKVERARRDGGDLELEVRLRMPDERIKCLQTVSHRIQLENGRLEYWGAVQDVTERKRSEEALGKIRSELAHMARVMSLGTLAASIAHEINQPLSGIITNASTSLRMLASDPPNIEGARETARRTIRDGNRASDVIKRLRALFAKDSVRAEGVDLNEAAREVIALIAHDLQRNRVTLRTELAQNLPAVTGDRVQLQQVILNLLLNAADAMSDIDDRPRQLSIRTGLDEGDLVRLSVQDAGIGFEPQAVDRLFEAFYTTKSGGMGIGLSVSRSIIESHRGRLWATPNDGAGATFSFSIPSR